MPNGGNVKEGGLLWYMASEVPGQRGGGEAWWWGLLCLWWRRMTAVTGSHCGKDQKQREEIGTGSGYNLQGPPLMPYL